MSENDLLWSYIREYYSDRRNAPRDAGVKLHWSNRLANDIVGRVTARMYDLAMGESTANEITDIADRIRIDTITQN